MKKPSARRVALPVSFALLLGLAAVARQDPDAVDLRLVPVAGSVHVLHGAGGNIGVSQGEDGVLIVDDQFAWLAPRIDETLRELDEAGPRFVVNTHHHGDHTGGNEYFGRSATIVAHANVRRRLEEGGGQRDVPPAPRAALPVVTYGDAGEGLSLHFNGEEIRLIHIPGAHTDGDTAVWFTESKVVHLGDTFFAGRFPYIDVASGGDVRGMIAGLERLLEMLPADVRVIPGHGEVCGEEELREFVAMLHETSSRIAEGVANGRTSSDLRQMQIFGDYDPSWGSGYVGTDAWIQILVDCLSRE